MFRHTERFLQPVDRPEIDRILQIARDGTSLASWNRLPPVTLLAKAYEFKPEGEKSSEAFEIPLPCRNPAGGITAEIVRSCMVLGIVAGWRLSRDFLFAGCSSDGETPRKSAGTLKAAIVS